MTIVTGSMQQGSTSGSTTRGSSGATHAIERPDPISDLGARSPAWASLHSSFVDVRGTQVHTIRGGLRPEDGGADVPHLFIHGLGGGATNWLEVMGALGGDREVITMDMPGFGRTVPPRFSAARVRANARFIPAFMDTLGIERAIVHGNSMGGMLTALLASIAPERIERAIMVDPALPTAKSDLTHLPGPVARRFAPFVVPGVGSTALRAVWARTDVDTLVKEGLDMTVADVSRITPAMLAVMRENLQIGKRNSWRVESLAYATESLVAALLGGREVAEGVRAMSGDTLVIWGDEDALVGRPVIDHLVGMRPDWATAVLPGCGHTPMIEEPARYLAIVEAWLAGRPVTDVDGVISYEALASA